MARSVDDIEWGDGPPERVRTAQPRRCKHPRGWRRAVESPAGLIRSCGRCGHVFDTAVVRRNRNNRSRGNSIERQVCADLGVTPRGRFGDPVDGGSDVDPYLVQVKTGGYFKPRQQAIIDAMDGQRRGRPAILVTVETPGPGHRARRLVTMTYEDFRWLVDRNPTTGSATPDPSVASVTPKSRKP